MFSDYRVLKLIRAVAESKPSQEIMALEDEGVGAELLDQMWLCGEFFKEQCKLYLMGAKANRAFYDLAQQLAKDAWDNEQEPSAQEVLRAHEERRNDAREMNRYR